MNRLSVFGVFLVSLFTSACVTMKTHKGVVADLQQTLSNLAATEADLGATQQKLDVTEKLRSEATIAQERCMGALGASSKEARERGEKLLAVEQEIGKLNQNREGLEAHIAQLSGNLKQLEEIKREADAQSKSYKRLVEQMRALIDTKQLDVKFRKGRIVVSLANDVLFSSGGTEIKDTSTLIVLAAAIREMNDRTFQVVGHTDTTPIRTQRFPSNWELATQRATEVVKLLVREGVNPGNVVASGAGEYDPIADNKDVEGRHANRRVEIWLMPKFAPIQELVSGDAPPATARE